MSFRRAIALLLLVLFASISISAQSKTKPSDKFRQLEGELPTPNEQRTASGAPGNKYWQQRADYNIDVELDDVNQRIIGKENVVYKNNSPDTLDYIWLQLDQNIFAKDSGAEKTRTAPDFKSVPLRTVDQLVNREGDFKVKLDYVRDGANKDLKYVVNDTMMRIDLPTPLLPNQQFVFNIAWNYNITNARVFGGRTGYEFFPQDGNYIYEMAQWFPRMAAYHDSYGWQHKQFLGSGEFTLEFGNYNVKITTPNDHVVSATGVLQNPNQVLTAQQRQRLTESKTAREPIKIVTQAEATANESSKPTGKKTWVFKADNVRDFAFASSRKFIWDAQGHNVEGNNVMAMSFYPKEGNPLWEKFSTQAIIHTLNVYSRYSFGYPYPVAQSVNGPIGGMEYPMICYNGPRPEADGTYSAGTKYGLISVVIHEVGHNYFPMIVNSDERQWTWMDEGLNSFLQYLAEQEWEKNYPSRRGEPRNIADYMASEDQVPIMTNSDSVLQFGNNAYGKPATALNILRETVMGRELFDYSFKQYSKRWKFKRPQPADFFRSMEDASGVDLDWFWRGWFYTTDDVDISIENVKLYQINTQNPDIEKGLLRQQRDAQRQTLSNQRNQNLPLRTDQYPSLRDFYNDYDQFKVTEQDRQTYQQFIAGLSDKEKQLVNGGYNFYVIDLKNIGGLVMPVIIKAEYTDGTSEEFRTPAEIWRYNNFDVSKLIATKKEVKAFTLDPNSETADVDVNNNNFPRRAVPTRFQVFKQAQFGRQPQQPNVMRQSQQPSQTQNNAPIVPQQTQNQQPQTNNVQPTTTSTPQPNATSTTQKPSESPNLTGRWNIAIDAGGQIITLMMNLTQNGNVVTGTVESPQGASTITSGTITGNAFTIKSTAGANGEITFTGKLENSALSGNVEAPQGATTFTGTKAQ